MTENRNANEVAQGILLALGWLFMAALKVALLVVGTLGAMLVAGAWGLLLIPAVCAFWWLAATAKEGK